MRNRILFILLLSGFIWNGAAQEIYSKAYGDPDHPALIFLHGGPGYNSASFEFTTAEELSQSGFYVITYDRSGEGRSSERKAQFTFEEAFQDLLDLYKKYDVKKAVLLGHSFGGMVSILFSERYPDKVNANILIGAPINLQDSFKHIITSSEQIYKKRDDAANLNYIKMLKAMDTTSLEYSTYSLTHAMQNDFYSTENPSEASKEIYEALSEHPDASTLANKMTYQAPQGFWQNESYTTLNLKDNLKNSIENGVKTYGIYGKEDGLYAPEQIQDLKRLIDEDHVGYLDHASHSVFIDQQEQFISLLKRWLLDK